MFPRCTFQNSNFCSKKTTAMFRPPPPLCFHRPTKDALKCELVLLRPQGHLWIQVLCLLKPGTCVAKPRGDFHEIHHWVSLNKGLIKGTWFLGGGGNWGSPLRLPWWLKNNRWHRCLHIGLFLDPLLIYLLVSVSSILTLRYICWFPLNDVCVTHTSWKVGNGAKDMYEYVFWRSKKIYH